MGHEWPRKREEKDGGCCRVTQAFEHKDTMQASNEDIVTQRKLKFLMFMVELAAKDPEWNGQLKDMAQAFGEVEQ
jgi:hypothetical protein